MTERSAARGFVEPAVQAEFPGLRLDWMIVPAPAGPSPLEVRQRLMGLSNRYRGANVVAMRTQPIPHAYRTFFRQIGLDPDATRIPSEEAALQRLVQGGFRSGRLLDDALLIALVETGVPIWALDADRLAAGGPGIRTSAHGERLGSSEHARHLPEGRLVIADAEGVHALLFDDVAPGHAPHPGSEQIALYAVAVEGVPVIHVEEALWVCVEALGYG